MGYFQHVLTKVIGTRNRRSEIDQEHRKAAKASDIRKLSSVNKPIRTDVISQLNRRNWDVSVENHFLKKALVCE